MKKSIKETYPNAWSFENTDKQLTSPDQELKIEYGELIEIAMGAPLAGQCFLLNKKGEKILIDEWCGGPPIWDTDGKKIAAPKWTHTLLRGVFQQLLILDAQTGELTLYKKKFNVLNLRTFDKNKIYGYDFPIHKTRTVKFDLETEKIKERRKITGANGE